MSTPLPMMHDCCWQKHDLCDSTAGNDILAVVPRGVAKAWRAFARWQIRKLERRIAALEPDSRWLH